MNKVAQCEGCFLPPGHDWREPWGEKELVDGIRLQDQEPDGGHPVERCDTCAVYDSDQAALDGLVSRYGGSGRNFRWYPPQ